MLRQTPSAAGLRRQAGEGQADIAMYIAVQTRSAMTCTLCCVQADHMDRRVMQGSGPILVDQAAGLLAASVLQLLGSASRHGRPGHALEVGCNSYTFCLCAFVHVN